MTGFDPEAWLEVAELCCHTARQAAAEAHLRSALNRAYYAALLVTKRRIEQALGTGAVPRARTHHAILRAVRSGGPRFEHIHRVLQRLREFREAADYELRTGPLAWNTVYSQVQESRNLIRRHLKAIPDAEYRKLTL